MEIKGPQGPRGLEPLARQTAESVADASGAISRAVDSFAREGLSPGAFPDVVKTPSPGGPVPIPYPRVALPAGAERALTELEVKLERLDFEAIGSALHEASADTLLAEFLKLAVEDPANEPETQEALAEAISELRQQSLAEAPPVEGTAGRGDDDSAPGRALTELVVLVAQAAADQLGRTETVGKDESLRSRGTAIEQMLHRAVEHLAQRSDGLPVATGLR